MPAFDIRLETMHFRIRKNIVQFVRTTYNSDTKKPKAMIVGRIPLDESVIPEELRALLTAPEIAEAEAWVANRHRTMLLREELAALTLSETLAMANRWFARQGESEAAGTVATGLMPELQVLRKTLKKHNPIG